MMTPLEAEARARATRESSVARLVGEALERVACGMQGGARRFEVNVSYYNGAAHQVVGMDARTLVLTVCTLASQELAMSGWHVEMRMPSRLWFALHGDYSFSVMYVVTPSAANGGGRRRRQGLDSAAAPAV